MLIDRVKNPMDNNYIKNTSIPGLFILERPTNKDERGFFREVFHLDELNKALGFEFKPIQMNHSKSQPKVLRGLHAEGWNKLIYPITGSAFAAIVDIRPDSTTFAKVETFEFDESNQKALFIQKGLANSFCVKGDQIFNYVYLVDSYWDGSDQRAIAWDDPDLNIDWPIEDPIISERDRNNSKLRDLFPEKFR